jgi:hypothetical protein
LVDTITLQLFNLISLITLQKIDSKKSTAPSFMALILSQVDDK